MAVTTPTITRDELVERAWEQPDSSVVGTVTLVYDHHVRMLNEKLTDLQHSHFHHILSTLHVHLDHDNCLEVIFLRGPAKTLRDIAGQLRGLKGIRKGQLVVANAAMMFFSENEFDRAAQSIASVIKERGWFVAFDLFHPFDQSFPVFSAKENQRELWDAERPAEGASRTNQPSGRRNCVTRPQVRRATPEL